MAHEPASKPPLLVRLDRFTRVVGAVVLLAALVVACLGLAVSILNCVYALVVEARVPAGSRPRTNLLISDINHGYRRLDRKVGLKQEPCNVDVVCPEGDPFRDEIRSVAQIIVGGQYTCTATLLNNTSQDGTPYAITAQHCFDDFADPAQTATTVVLYWNFQSQTCGALGGGSRSQNQSGSTLAAASPWDSGSEIVVAAVRDRDEQEVVVVGGGLVDTREKLGEELAGGVGDDDPEDARLSEQQAAGGRVRYVAEFVGRLLDAHRLPDEPDGHGPGRVSIRGLPEGRRAIDHRRLHRGDDIVDVLLAAAARLNRR